MTTLSKRAHLTVIVASAALVGGMVGSPLAGVAASVAHKIDGSRLKPNSVTGTQVKESTLGTVPQAKLAKALPTLKWTSVSLINGWEAAERFPAVALSSEGIVYMRGAITGSSATDEVAFVLPTAMRPTSGYVLLASDQSVSETGSVFISTDGSVSVRTDPSDPSSDEYASLEGLLFALG
jgi:hypothetical protein